MLESGHLVGGVKRDWVSVEDARAYLRAHGVKSYPQWQRHIREHDLPPGIPRNPHVAYRLTWKEFSAPLSDLPGVPRFRGGGRKRVEIVPYEEARSWAREQGITSQAQWNALRRAERLPPNFPRHPHVQYKEWQGWPAFLGKDPTAPYLAKTYDLGVFQAYVQQHGLRTFRAWEAHAMSTTLPDDIPRNPLLAFKRPWTEVSGKRTRGNRHAFMPFETAKRWVRRNGVTSRDEYLRVYDKRRLPYAPEKVYTEWAGWKDFLGVESPRTSRDYLTYEDAKLLVRELKLASKSQYDAYVKTHPDARLPRMPSYTYRAVWAGYPAFLRED